MRQIFLFLLLTAGLNTVQAQDLGKFSVELSALRYSRAHGLSEAETTEFSYANGFNVSYRPSKLFQYFIGLRNANAAIESYGIDTHASTSKRGAEIRLGGRFTPFSDKRLFVSLGLEAFAEFSKLKGTYDGGFNAEGEHTDFFFNHQRNYVGVAPSLMLNIRISERIWFFADTRYRSGYMTLRGTKPDFPYQELF